MVGTLVVPEKLVYSVAEAAQVLGISRAKMYELVRVDGFPVLHIGNRKVVSRKGLERWVDKQAGLLDEMEGL